MGSASVPESAAGLRRQSANRNVAQDMGRVNPPTPYIVGHNRQVMATGHPHEDLERPATRTPNSSYGPISRQRFLLSGRYWGWRAPKGSSQPNSRLRKGQTWRKPGAQSQRVYVRPGADRTAGLPDRSLQPTGLEGGGLFVIEVTRERDSDTGIATERAPSRAARSIGSHPRRPILLRTLFAASGGRAGAGRASAACPEDALGSSGLPWTFGYSPSCRCLYGGAMMPVCHAKRPVRALW